MKTIKIIDLLNLVYENKAPKKIKYNEIVFYYYAKEKFYYNDGYSLYREFYAEGNCLNDKVEIIEEKSKSIEKIKMNGNEFYSEYIDGWIKKSEFDAYGEYLSNKLNEVIDLVNDLLEKSDKDE